MRKWKLKNGYELIKVLGLRCYTFLLTTEKGNILIDTGRKNRREDLLNNIKRIKTPKPGIDFLIVTHSHFDHCENAAYLQTVTECKIIMSEKEKEYAEKGQLYVPANMKTIAGKISTIVSNLGKYEPFMPDITFNGNFSLKAYGF